MPVCRRPLAPSRYSHYRFGILDWRNYFSDKSVHNLATPIACLAEYYNFRIFSWQAGAVIFKKEKREINDERNERPRQEGGTADKKTGVLSFSLLAEKTLPFRLRWGIAENGWDKKVLKRRT
jgi:hypothetical protein